MIETLRQLATSAGHGQLWEFERRELTMKDIANRYFDGEASISGVHVSPMSAMQQSAVWACDRILRGQVASLPLITYRMDESGREVHLSHYLYDLLLNAPNDRMSAYTFKSMMQHHVLMRGNAFAAIAINGRGQVTGLYPMHPDRVHVDTRGDSVFYEYHGAKKTALFPADLVFHLRWMSDDGIIGKSPIEAARTAIGSALASDRLAGKFFERGMKSSGVFMHPGKLSKDARENLSKSLISEYAGLENVWKTMILEEGMKFEPLQMKWSDAEFLASRKFGIAEISRTYGVPLHMLAELDRATYASIEQENRAFITYSLSDHLVNWQSEIPVALLTKRERASVFVEFDTDSLLAGDQLARYQAYQLAIRNRVMSPNEAREMEHMKRVDGGDEFFIQMQDVPVTSKKGITDGKD